MTHSCKRYADYDLDTARFVDEGIVEIDGECQECGASLEGSFILDILEDTFHGEIIHER